MTLKVRGIHYDVGHEYGGKGPGNTRPYFERDDVESDMAMIAGQLHANSVRIAGTDLSRLTTASELALKAGLTVWISPHPGERTSEQVVSYLAEAAEAAEELRSVSGSVIMIAGCELSLFSRGFLPGATLDDRLAALMGGDASIDLSEHFRELPRRLGAVLGESVAAIRQRFHGQVTYASAPWESVDWTPFNIVSVDLYRDSSNAIGYEDSLRSYQRFGKPVAVTEFGCCTYAGAADAGGAGFAVLDYDAQLPGWRLNVAGLERSEAEQARYANDLLAVFEREGIEGAFWHTFAGWDFPRRPEPEEDLDIGSFGLVSVIESPGTGAEHRVLEPKDAFRTIAAAYRKDELR